jgi:hypothetical protein
MTDALLLDSRTPDGRSSEFGLAPGSQLSLFPQNSRALNNIINIRSITTKSRAFSQFWVHLSWICRAWRNGRVYIVL